MSLKLVSSNPSPVKEPYRKKGFILTCYSCEKPYAELTRDVFTGEVADASHVRSLQGHSIENGDRPICQLCGNPAAIIGRNGLEFGNA